MRNPNPLQGDLGFEMLRFRHSERLSQRVFEKLLFGRLVSGKSIGVSDRHPWKLSAGRRKGIDDAYRDFSDF